MHQSKRLRALAVIPFVALALCAQSDGSQAAAGQVVQAAAHSSRWDYPRETTPGASQEVHVVQKGDTLWDLGTQYLGNPFAWPQIWELNKWVKDPHWIYPGDPILVESSRRTVNAKGKDLPPREVADLQPDLRRVRKPSLNEYVFTFQDFIQMPFLQMPFLVPGTGEDYFKQVGAFKLVGKEDSTRAMLADGDFLYVGGGSNQGVKTIPTTGGGRRSWATSWSSSASSGSPTSTRPSPWPSSRSPWTGSPPTATRRPTWSRPPWSTCCAPTSSARSR
jgi:hypothetical protein